MPKITIHRDGEAHQGDIAADSNLVVLAGIRKFPYPHLSYMCGMGKCGPNWREKKTLGDDALAEGYRLVCQLRIFEDFEIEQEGPVRGPRKRMP